MANVIDNKISLVVAKVGDSSCHTSDPNGSHRQVAKEDNLTVSNKQKDTVSLRESSDCSVYNDVILSQRQRGQINKQIILWIKTIGCFMTLFVSVNYK